MSDYIATDLRFSIVPTWLLDKPISDRALRLYAVLAKYADSETGQAFPGRTLLSRQLDCSLKSVDRAVQELLDIGAITKRQRIKDNHYQSSLYTVVRVDPSVTPDATPRHPRRDPVSPVTHRTITTELEPDNYIDTTFNEFWSVYPKKADKRAAKKAFKSALKRASLEVIISGARKYAADPNREDRFTKNPATWLNADAWENESLPSKITNLKPPAEGPGRGDWIKQLHDIGEHFACKHD